MFNFNIFLFFIAIIILCIGIISFNSNRKSDTNRIFLILSFGMAAWPIAIAMFRISTTYESVFFWCFVVYAIGIFIGPLLTAFSFIFPKEKAEISSFFKTSSFLYILIFLWLLFFSGHWIEEIILNNNGNSAQLGFSYFLWGIAMSIFVAWSLVKLFMNYKKSQGIEKKRFLNIFLGFGSLFLFAIPCNIILPLFGDCSLIWAGPFGILLFILFLSIAIAKYGIFSMKVILTDFLVITMGATLLALPFMTEDFIIRIITAIVFIIFCVLGYMLVKSVHKEIRQKEILEQKVVNRTKELQKAKDDLEEANSILEIKVKARTRELQELNNCLENKVEERTFQLKKRLDELERFGKATVGRELKMAELKKMIEEKDSKIEELKKKYES